MILKLIFFVGIIKYIQYFIILDIWYILYELLNFFTMIKILKSKNAFLRLNFAYARLGL